jgi:hypothetical protein
MRQHAPSACTGSMGRKLRRKTWVHRPHGPSVQRFNVQLQHSEESHCMWTFALLHEGCNNFILLTPMNQVRMVKDNVKQSAYHNAPSVATSNPVGICDLNLLPFHLILLLEPFLQQLFSCTTLGILVFTVWKKRGVCSRVLVELLMLLLCFRVCVIAWGGCSRGRIDSVAVVIEGEGEHCHLSRLLLFLHLLLPLPRQILHIK